MCKKVNKPDFWSKLVVEAFNHHGWVCVLTSTPDMLTSCRCAIPRLYGVVDINSKHPVMINHDYKMKWTLLVRKYKWSAYETQIKVWLENNYYYHIISEARFLHQTEIGICGWWYSLLLNVKFAPIYAYKTVIISAPRICVTSQIKLGYSVVTSQY